MQAHPRRFSFLLRKIVSNLITGQTVRGQNQNNERTLTELLADVDFRIKLCIALRTKLVGGEITRRRRLRTFPLKSLMMT